MGQSRRKVRAMSNTTLGRVCPSAAGLGGSAPGPTRCLAFARNAPLPRPATWLAWVVLACSVPGAWAALPSEVDGEPLPTLAPMLERTSPGVVNIATFARTRSNNPLLNDPFFRQFFSVPERRTRSAGSGVIVDAATGHVVTNHHVVNDADEIRVTLSDGREFGAELVGVDPQVDLAVLRIAADELVEIDFADSRSLRVGDFVVAIGNPFGLDQTVTSGIVSALGRSGLGIEGYEDFIQTDASINPGNSGGALVDLNGALVGINTAIVAPSGGNVGIGFAIPSNLVEAIMAHLIKFGEVRRGDIGIAVEALDPQLAEALGAASAQGVVVVEVAPGSIAEDAGMRPGDVVTAVDGRLVRRIADYTSESALAMVGDRLVVEVVRDGERLDLALVIDDNRSVAGDRIDARLTGATLMNFREDGDPASSVGVVVSDLVADTRAAGQGLREGDIIIGVNNLGVVDIAELARRLGDASRARLRVYRGGRYGYLSLR